MSTYSVEENVKLNGIDGFYNETIKANHRVKIFLGEMVIATMLVSGDVCFAEESQTKLLTPVNQNVCQYYEITNASENTLNLQNYSNIMESFDSHKGRCATEEFRIKFKNMAMSMSVLPYNETLARYSVVNEVNTLLLTFNNGLELNLTQSLNQDEVAFSIHHNGVMLLVGSSSPDDLAKKMLHVINEPISIENGLS